MKGSTYRRCYCRGDDGRPLGAKCAKLSSKRHGTWAVRQELPPREDGTRRAYSSGGHDTAGRAQEELDRVRAVLAVPDGDDAAGQTAVGDLLEAVSKTKNAPLPSLEEVRRKYASGLSLSETMTVGEWLGTWAASKKTKAKTTASYMSHIRVHLVPHLGTIRLDRLNVAHVQAMFDAIDDQNEVVLAENAARREQQMRATWGARSRPPAADRDRLAAERAVLEAMPPYRRVTGAATQQRIRATLRTALNAAITRQLRTWNPASFVELESGKRPRAMLWTPQRVEHWRATGERPGPVMVWTPEQIGAFLDAAESSRLYAFFHLLAFRGLRRGEGVGLGWHDVDLDAQTVTVATTIIVGTDGWTPEQGTPKTEESAGTIALDSVSVGVLREHRARQDAERAVLGAAWASTGKVFVQPDGTWLHPEKVSDEFRRIVSRAGLPPVSLRDVRHAAATLVHAGSGGDIHAVKEVLRHSTIQLTSNTYTSLLREADVANAEKAALLVPRARRSEGSSGTDAHAPLTQKPVSHSD